MLFHSYIHFVRIKYTLSIVARCSLAEQILSNQFEIEIFLSSAILWKIYSKR